VVKTPIAEYFRSIEKEKRVFMVAIRSKGRVCLSTGLVVRTRHSGRPYLMQVAAETVRLHM
jgi:hypothetical protein